MEDATTPEQPFEFQFLKIFTSLWAQVESAPSHVLLFLALIPFGILIKRSPLPNWLIPWVLVLVGTIVYPLLASPKNISPDIQHPYLVLGIFGFLLGVAALISHVVLEKAAWFRRVERALIAPFKTGDTQVIKRS